MLKPGDRSVGSGGRILIPAFVLLCFVASGELLELSVLLMLFMTPFCNLIQAFQVK